MPRRHLLCLALVPVVIPAVALAAPKAGSYSGTSSGRYIQVGQATEPTDKGKVSFTVKGKRVLNFKLRGQLIQCGPPAEVPVTVKTIKLNAAGKGSAVFKDASIGSLKVSIAVTSRGKASGKVVAPPKGSLCNDDYPVTFTAKRR